MPVITSSSSRRPLRCPNNRGHTRDRRSRLLVILEGRRPSHISHLHRLRSPTRTCRGPTLRTCRDHPITRPQGQCHTIPDTRAGTTSPQCSQASTLRQECPALPRLQGNTCTALHQGYRFPHPRCTTGRRRRPTPSRACRGLRRHRRAECPQFQAKPPLLVILSNSSRGLLLEPRTGRPFSSSRLLRSSLHSRANLPQCRQRVSHRLQFLLPFPRRPSRAQPGGLQCLRRQDLPRQLPLRLLLGLFHLDNNSRRNNPCTRRGRAVDTNTRNTRIPVTLPTLAQDLSKVSSLWTYPPQSPNAYSPLQDLLLQVARDLPRRVSIRRIKGSPELLRRVSTLLTRVNRLLVNILRIRGNPVPGILRIKVGSRRQFPASIRRTRVTQLLGPASTATRASTRRIRANRHRPQDSTHRTKGSQHRASILRTRDNRQPDSIRRIKGNPALPLRLEQLPQRDPRLSSHRAHLHPSPLDKLHRHRRPTEDVSGNVGVIAG